MKPKKRIKHGLRKYQKLPDPIPALLGNSRRTIKVPNRVNYVYARIGGIDPAIEVYNDRVPPLLDLPVFIGYDPKEPHRLQVLNKRSGMTRYGDDDDDQSTYEVGPHHKTHEWMAHHGGTDVVFSELRQFMPLRTTPDGMNIHVRRSVFMFDDQWTGLTGTTLDLSSYIPATGAQFYQVYEDLDGTVGVTGGVIRDLSTLELGDMPPPIPGTLPIAGVRLYDGQTGIAEARSYTDIVDLRFPFVYTFPILADTPATYVDSASKVVMVSDDETELVFVEASDVGGGGGIVPSSGSFLNPMTDRGDMIYSNTGSVLGSNQSVWELGAIATASSEFSPVFTPADYALRSHILWDSWQNLLWAGNHVTDGGILNQWIYINLGSQKSILAWRLKQSSDIDNRATQYTVAKSNDAAGWTDIVTHDVVSDDEFVYFPSAHTAQYFRAKVDTSSSPNPATNSWKVYHFFLFLETAGQVPTRLPIGNTDQVLSVSPTAIPQWSNRKRELLIYDDGVFQVTGTAIDFTDFLEVIVTGSIAYVSWTGTQGHVIQDDGVAENQRANLNFVGDGFEVYDDVGNNATIISGTASGDGAGIVTGTVDVYDNSVFEVAAEGISFDTNLDVSVTGVIAFVEAVQSEIYLRVGQPNPLLSVTGTYWQVPDKSFVTGSLATFIDGLIQVPVTSFVEQYASSGTYQYTDTPPTGSVHVTMYGVRVIGTIPLDQLLVDSDG